MLLMSHSRHQDIHTAHDSAPGAASCLCPRIRVSSNPITGVTRTRSIAAYLTECLSAPVRTQLAESINLEITSDGTLRHTKTHLQTSAAIVLSAMRGRPITGYRGFTPIWQSYRADLPVPDTGKASSNALSALYLEGHFMRICSASNIPPFRYPSTTIFSASSKLAGFGSR